MRKSYMTSDKLIRSVIRRAMIPRTQNTFANEDFLEFADEEMDLGVVPTILRLHEGYLLYSDPVPVTPNSNRYEIPYRAVGNKLKEASYKDTSGNVYEMTQIGIEDLYAYNQTSSGNPRAFYVENNEVVLVPTTSVSTGFIVMTYYMRPNSLVMLEEVGTISNIDRNTGIILLSNLPEDFSLSEQYDFVSTKSPNKTLKFDFDITDLNLLNKSVTVDAANIPANLQVGDYLCLAGTSAIPQIPSDMHVLLAQRVACRCLDALGDAEGLASAMQKLAELTKQAETLIDNRVEDAPRKVVNRHSTLKTGRYGRRGRFIR